MQITSKLLEIYSNKNEHDELRIAALMSLSKCSAKEIMKRVVEVYSSETSKQGTFIQNLVNIEKTYVIFHTKNI